MSMNDPQVSCSDTKPLQTLEKKFLSITITKILLKSNERHFVSSNITMLNIIHLVLILIIVTVQLH